MTNIKERVIKDAALYGFSSYVAQGLGFIYGFIIRKLLGPYLMGIWSGLSLIFNYSSYTLMGINAAISIKIPYYRAKGNLEEAERAKNTVFTYMFFTTLAWGMVICLVAFFLRNRLSPIITIGLVAVAIILLFIRIYNYFIVLLRAYKNFLTLSQIVVITAVFDIAFGVVFIKKFSIYGLYLANVLSLMMSILYVYWRSKYRIIFTIDYAKLKELLKIGFPLFILGFSGAIFRSIDKLLILKMLGATQLGFYSVAFMVGNFVYGISNNFAVIMLPRFQEAYAKSDSAMDIKNYVLVPTFILSYMLAIIIGLLYIGFPLFISSFLPKYIPGINAMRILIIGVFFLSIYYPSYQFMITLGKQMMLLPLTAFAILVNLILGYIFVKLGWGTQGVALAAVIAYLVAYLLASFMTHKHFSSPREYIKFLFSIFIPFVYFIGLAIYIDLALFKNMGIFLSQALRLILFCILSIPLVWHLNKKTSIVSMGFKILKDKLS